jgi:hypothetical protein
MKKRIGIWLTICVVVVMLSQLAPRSTAQQRAQMGGRPGEFHFILKEQAEHNRAEFREMQVRIERMRADITKSSTDDVTRARLLGDVSSFEMFVTSMEAQLTSPAGQTAGEVEARLNTVKGQVNCGTCHEGSSASTGVR